MSSPHHHSGPPSFPGVPHCLGGAPGARGGAGGGGAPAWPPGGRPGAASSPGGGKRTARGGTSSSVQPGFLPASLLQGGAVRAVVTKPEDKTRVDDVQQQTAYRNINEEEPCLARQVQQQTAKRTPQEDEEARPSSSQGQGGNNPPAHVNNPLCVDVDVDVPGRDLNMPEQNTHTPAATNDDDDVPASDPANNNTDTQQHHNADAADAPSSAAAEAPPHSSTTPPPPQRAPSSPPPPTLSRLRSTSAKELDDEALARRLSVALNARPRRTAVVTTVPTKIQRQASVGGELVDGEPVCFACKRTHSSAGLVPDVPCCHAGCYKMYHAHCVKLGGATGPNNRGLVKVTMKGKRWVCGHHVCADGMDDGNGALVTCAMCPTAYASERVPKTFVRDSDESCVGLCHTCACVVAAAVDSRTKITARSGSQGDEVVLREELSAARRYWEQVAQPTIERTLNPHEAPPPPPPVPPPLPPPRTQPQAQKTRARHNDRRNDEGDDEDEEEAQQQTEEEEEEEEEEEVEEEPRSALNQFDCPLYAAPPPRRAANKGIQRFDPSAPVNVGAFANTKSRKTTTTTTKTAVARAPPKGSSSSLPSKSRSTTNTPSDVIMPPPPPPPRRVLDRNVRLDEVDMVDGDEVRDKKTESVKVSAPTSRKRKQEQQRVSAKSKKRVSKGERMTNRAAGAACAAPMNTYDDVDDGDDHVDYDDDEAEIDDVVNEDAAVKCLMGLADAPMVGANVHNTTTTKQPTKQTRESSKPKRNNTGTPTSTLTPKPTRPTTAITPETKQQPKLVSAKVQAQAQATRVVPLDTIPRKLAKPKSPPAVTITPTTEGVHSTDVVASPSASETQAAGIDAIAVARAAAAAAMRPFWKKQQSGDGKKSVEEKVCSDEATTVPLLEVAPRSVSQAWPDDEKAAGEDLSRGGEKSVGRSRSRSRSPVRNSGPSEEELSILCALESGFVTRNDLMNLVRMKKLDAANQAIVSLANGPEARRLGITAAYCICQLDVSPCIAEAAHRQMEASRTAGLPTPNVAIRVLPFIGEKWQCDGRSSTRMMNFTVGIMDVENKRPTIEDAQRMFRSGAPMIGHSLMQRVNKIVKEALNGGIESTQPPPLRSQPTPLPTAHGQSPPQLPPSSLPQPPPPSHAITKSQPQQQQHHQRQQQQLLEEKKQYPPPPHRHMPPPQQYPPPPSLRHMPPPQQYLPPAPLRNPSSAPGAAYMPPLPFEQSPAPPLWQYSAPVPPRHHPDPRSLPLGPPPPFRPYDGPSSHPHPHAERFRRGDSPERFRRADSPERFRRGSSPERFRRGSSPERFRRGDSPEPRRGDRHDSSWNWNSPPSRRSDYDDRDRDRNRPPPSHRRW